MEACWLQPCRAFIAYALLKWKRREMSSLTRFCMDLLCLTLPDRVGNNTVGFTPSWLTSRFKIYSFEVYLLSFLRIGCLILEQMLLVLPIFSSKRLFSVFTIFCERELRTVCELGDLDNFSFRAFSFCLFWCSLSMCFMRMWFSCWIWLFLVLQVNSYALSLLSLQAVAAGGGARVEMCCFFLESMCWMDSNLFLCFWQLSQISTIFMSRCWFFMV